MTRRVNGHLPNQIRHYRRKRNLSLKQVSLAAGLESAAHLAHWEKGRKTPTLRNALKLSIVIKCPVEVLFFDMYDSLRREIQHNQEQLTTNSNDHEEQQPSHQ